MFPHIQAQDRRLAFCERAILIGAGLDGKRTVRCGDQPRPARPKERTRRGGGGELLLEAPEGAEGGVYGVRQPAGGSSAPSGPMICQNMEWFEWPPALFLTAVLISSGT